jgi:hypothetical protein
LEVKIVIANFTALSAKHAKSVPVLRFFLDCCSWAGHESVSPDFSMWQPPRNLLTYMASYFRMKNALLLVCCVYAVAAVASDSVTGRVRNQTIGRPAAGDEVVLLRMGNGMEEEARTRTDAEGAFSLPVAVPKAQHIVRVFHEAVNYDQTVNGAVPLEISVYDAVPKIPDLSGNLGMVQVESDGTMLKLTEMYSINNISSPPVTQSKPRNFEISIPPKAVLDSVMVKRAAGIWVNAAPAPVPGSKNRYAVDFPLRPGDTLFKFIYQLPDEGSTVLRLKLPYPIQNFAVLHPPSMSFKASHPHAFSSPGLVQGLKLEQAVRKPVVGEVPAFEISGRGTAPTSVSKGTTTSTQPVAGLAVHLNTKPAQAPTAASAAPAKEIWALGFAFAALLVAAVTGRWRRKRMGGQRATPNRQSQTSAMETLKKELLQLETDRQRGVITDEQYYSSRHALDLGIRRAIASGTADSQPFIRGK